MASTSNTADRETSLVPLAAVLAVLIASNVATNVVLPDWAYVPWNLAVAALLVTIAVRLDRRTVTEMGLSRERLGAGLGLGGLVSAALAAVMIAGVLIPVTRELFMDERANVPFWEMAYKVLIEVPIGTVLLEEITFRGILPAMFAARLEPWRRRRLIADGIAAVLFGLWHILPSLSLGRSNDEISGEVAPLVLQIGGVTVSVLFTAAIAMGLSWMRNRSDSVAAPAVLHTTANSLGSALAWVAQRVL